MYEIMKGRELPADGQEWQDLLGCTILLPCTVGGKILIKLFINMVYLKQN
jgi:hypothetical protein